MKNKSKLKETTSDRDAAELRRRDEAVTQAAEAWAREAPLNEVRRLAESTPGSWLSIEIPFKPNYHRPADGLYLIMFGPDAELNDADDIDSFWFAVLGDDAELLDDPAAARLFVDTVREVYRRRIAAARG